MNPSYNRPTGPPGLARYGSAPGSLLTGIADSIIGGGGGGGGGGRFPPSVGSDGMAGRLFSGDSPCLTSESSCKATTSPDLVDPGYRGTGGGLAGPGLQRSYGLGEISAVDLAAVAAADLKGGGPHLIRHSSSPAGFFSHLMVDDGLPVSMGVGHYPQPTTNGVHAMPSRRLKTQLSFSRQDALSKISEVGIPDMGESITCNSSDEAAGNVRSSYVSSDFPIGSWDETSSIVFSGPPSKRAKDNNGDISLSCIDSQYSLPNTSLEMASVENFLQIQQDSVPFKIRAKRGCATHPRSIAERERRTRISEKLRKLQELVPNMDKQTSTSDMLDLAVQHIKELQTQIQFIQQERSNCTCTTDKKELS